MKINSIRIKNFRCYESITLDLHDKLTVLVANNGQGKTALLDALRIGLWPYVSSFDLAKTPFADPANTITISDVLQKKTLQNGMARQLPTEIITTGDYGDEQKTWKRYRDSEAKNSKTKDDRETILLKNYALGLQTHIRDTLKSAIKLPVFGYYGTGRLWKQKRLTENKKGSKNRTDDQNIRTFAYRDSLDPASSYKQFEEWFTIAFKKIRESQIKQLEAGNASLKPDENTLNPVRVVQNAVNELLKSTGWQNLAYSERDDQSLVLQHPQKGTLKVDQLSDGIKNMLAMVADIAYRCALLNAHLGDKAALQSEGIVMIDEVDMHLHPQWQQTVIAGLKAAFPNIQWVVTTHSPQVLSTVDAESIRIITHEVDVETGAIHSFARSPDSQSRGVASADVMAAIQGVDPVPNVEEADWLKEYKLFIHNNQTQSNAAIQLREKLEQHFGKQHQKIIECDQLIRLQAMKTKFANKR
jgi:predicted ATP-binding protein involved in virulence